MKERATIKVTIEARNLLRWISEQTYEKHYSIITRLLRSERDRMKAKRKKQ